MRINPAILSLFVAILTLGLGQSRASAQNDILSIEGECPGEVVVRITDGLPTRGYWLIFSYVEGSFRIPNNQPCVGAILGIRGSVRLVIIFRTDENGNGDVTGRVGPAACGHFLQAIASDCEPTNVVQIP